MSEFEKYKNEILTIFTSTSSVEEIEEWIHDKWLAYDMTDETEEDLYKWLSSRKQAMGCEDDNNFIWRCQNCKKLCEDRNKTVVYM